MVTATAVLVPPKPVDVDTVHDDKKNTRTPQPTRVVTTNTPHSATTRLRKRRAASKWKRHPTHVPHRDQAYHVFDVKLAKMYRFKAEHVAPTRGREHYDKGHHVLLCPEHGAGRVCAAGSECMMLHGVTAHPEVAMVHVKGRPVHMNVTPIPYKTLPFGRVMEIYSKDCEECIVVPTQHILRTVGGDTWHTKAVPDRRVFHCEHFHTRKLCMMGSRCTFIHAVTAAGAEEAVTASGVDEAVVTGVESSFTTLSLPIPSSRSSLSQGTPLTSPTRRYRFNPYSMDTPCVGLQLPSRGSPC